MLHSQILPQMIHMHGIGILMMEEQVQFKILFISLMRTEPIMFVLLQLQRADLTLIAPMLLLQL